jgi:uncharacterized protein
MEDPIPKKPSTGKRILVSGASGLIGTALVRNLMRDQIHVTKLIRQHAGQSITGNPSASAPESIVWDPNTSKPVSDLTALIGVDAAIHLSGANIAAARWTENYKREIVSSRVQTTLALANLLRQLRPLPKVFVCASATGIYGDRGDEILTEESLPGTGFLAETCAAWENAARTAEDAGIRVVNARFGVVLTPEGGALARLLPLFRLGLGGKLGNGRAWMDWITLRDAVSIFRFAIDNETVRGPINLVAPTPVTNAEFTRALAAAVHRPAFLSVPAFALRLGIGQMADQALLASARALPAKLTTNGFRFADPEIGPALKNLLPA